MLHSIDLHASLHRHPDLSPNLTLTHLHFLQELLGGISTLHFVENEDLIDVVAAVSGSGPAYFFAFMHAMVKVHFTCALHGVEEAP